MLQEVEFCRNIIVPVADVSKRSIVKSLMDHLLYDKSSEQHGYFLAVTKLKSIGKGRVLKPRTWVLFPVVCKCRTFLPVRGETLEGIVYCVKRQGVFLKCGPTKNVYLSARKMPGYHFVPGDLPYFQNDQLDRIEVGVVVRFMTLDVKWMRNSPVNVKREFWVLASLESGESFGPVSLPAFDNSYIYE